MAGLLAGFLLEQARRPFEWGKSDCALFLADWVRCATGTETAGDLRGRYSCPASAAEVAGGDLHTVVAKCAARADLEIVEVARPGDIAVLRMPRHDVCGIRTPIGWAMRDRRRLFTVPDDDVEILICWRVPRWRPS